MNGRYVGAHRVAYVLLRGSIADGAHVLHNCDKPACVNPRHLRLGTPKDNAQDCIRRGRKNAATGARNGQHTHPERTARGEQIGISRLSEKQVRAIKRLLATGVQRMVLARRFNVAWQTVGNIAAGITWRHVA